MSDVTLWPISGLQLADFDSSAQLSREGFQNRAEGEDGPPDFKMLDLHKRLSRTHVRER